MDMNCIRPTNAIRYFLNTSHSKVRPGKTRKFLGCLTLFIDVGSNGKFRLRQIYGRAIAPRLHYRLV